VEAAEVAPGYAYRGWDDEPEWSVKKRAVVRKVEACLARHGLLTKWRATSRTLGWRRARPCAIGRLHRNKEPAATLGRTQSLTADVHANAVTNAVAAD